MISVELIYDADCPNVENARTNLLHAFHKAKVQPKWKEWIRSDPEAPHYVRTYGSPTIPTNVQDVADASPSDGASSCRLYMDETGQFQGVPSVETIVSALSKVKGSGTTTDRTEYADDNRKEVITMTTQRKVEVFSAGCPVCEETIELINRVACPSCEVSVLDMSDPDVADRAKELGIHSLPAVVIDSRLADCCAGRGPDEDALRAAGLGQPI